MSLSYQFIKKPLEGVKTLSDFNKNLIKLARKNENTYTQTVGDAYEVLAKAYFKLVYSETFKNVWYYNDIPYDIKKKLNLPEKDKGIDLLLENTEGKFTAVQSKFRGKDETILFWGGRDHLSHLIGSGTKCDSYAVFSNAYEIDEDVRSKMKEKEESFDVLNDTLSGLEESFWDNVRNLVEEHKPKAAETFSPYKDQQDAIDAVVNHFKSGNNRAKMIRFCGTGKSKTAKWIHNALNLDGLTVILVPSLSLAKQAKKDWGNNILFVCSDQTIRDDEDEISEDILSLGPNVTTDDTKIRKYAVKNPIGIIVSTYQSCHLLKKALKGIKVSLTIFDEAHRTASKEDSNYSTLLQDGDYVSQYRLFMTATERIVSAQVKTRQAKNADLPYLFSMDDESVYGKKVNDFNLRMAIDAKRVAPYIPVVTGITDEMIKENIVMRRLVKGIKAHSYDMYANVFACLQMIELKKVKHLIIYHKNIKASKEFIEILSKVRPDIYMQHIDGTMSAEHRALKFQEYASANIGILSNARCLTEGIDIPSVDCVVFCDPKSSKIDIIQAMGRAMRLDKNNPDKVAQIVIPIYITKKKLTEWDIDNSNYATLIYLLKALSEIDFKMQDFITNICIQKGRKHKPKGKTDNDSQGVEILAGVVDFLGDNFVKHFFLTEISDRAKNNWMYFYTLLVEYWREHGDCNVQIKGKNKSSLGNWVSKQRLNKDKLAKSRHAMLEKIGFSWDYHDDFWSEKYEELKKFKNDNGNCLIPRNHPTLGIWTDTQRQAFSNKKLPQEKIDKLNEIGFLWISPLKDFKNIWDKNYAELEKYYKKNKHCFVKDKENIQLKNWVENQRARKDNLTREQIKKLNNIEFPWEIKVRDILWEENYKNLIEYKRKHGNCLVPQRTRLGSWVTIQRKKWAEKSLSREQLKKLEMLDFSFNPREDKWNEMYDALLAYKKRTGNCHVPPKDGKLGKWVSFQRTCYRTKKIEKERIEKLNKIGFAWNLR